MNKTDTQKLKRVYDSADNEKAANSGVKYKSNKSFSEEFDKWNKTSAEKVFLIGTTSNALQKNAQRFIDSSKVLYIDTNKKRVSTFETRTGLQLPVGGADSNNSISENASKSQEKVSNADIDQVKNPLPRLCAVCGIIPKVIL